MPRIFAAVVAALLIFTAADAALAQGLVGATVPPDFPIGGKKAGDFKDKYTVFYFWAAKKPESVKGLKEAVRLFKAYGKNEKFGGFVLYNIDEPQDATQARQTVRDLPFEQVFDGPNGLLNRQVQVPVDKTPYTYLMSPGLQFVWAGPLGELEDQLIKVLQVEKAKAPVNPDSEDQAVSSMAEAIKIIQERGEYTPAVERLAGLTPRMLDDPTVMVAATQVVMLMKLEVENRNGIERALAKNPKAKNIIRIITRKAANTLNAPLPGEDAASGGAPTPPTTGNTRDALANRKLNEAEELQLNGNDISAYEQFKDIATRYRGTDAANTATQHIGDYEADPAFMKKYNAEAGEEKAQAMLRMAKSYKQAGRDDLVKKTITELMATYPDSAAAREAKAEGLAK